MVVNITSIEVLLLFFAIHILNMTFHITKIDTEPFGI